jgi:pimeloyl-ACP methyl ester carboxylesterase
MVDSVYATENIMTEKHAGRTAVWAATVRGILLTLAATLLLAGTALAQAPQSRFANVNGTRLHYLIAGHGDPVVLLHGYAETSHMWRPLISQLTKTHRVIAPDLRGAGQSATPPDGYTKAAMAKDIHALVQSLGLKRIEIVGHDIGLMVAYAYAAQYPNEVDRIVLMDAFLPGVGDWQSVWLLRDLWHFHFYGETPLALVHGRERIYLEHFWNDFAADRTHSIPERDRRIYAAAYARPGGMRAGFEYFRAFEQDAKDFARFAQTPLPMPMLVLTGEKASGEFLIQQGRLVATNVEGVVVKNSGHWLMEEAPNQVIPKLVEFLNLRLPLKSSKTSNSFWRDTDHDLKSNNIHYRARDNKFDRDWLGIICHGRAARRTAA